MEKLLHLRQGPGLNNLHLFYSNRTIPMDYCPKTDTTTFTLRSDCFLHIQGSYTEPCDKLLSPDVCKLLDILVCALGDELTDSCQAVLSLNDFIQLAGYKLTKTNRDAVRPQMKEHIALLEKIHLSWTEDGKYHYKYVKIFDHITYQNAKIYAAFTEQMAQYLLNQSPIVLPRSLLRISKRYYSLGRRCLIHQAINHTRTHQVLRAATLLAVCPYIPQPAPDEKWQPSILERKVITPFTAAMNSLADNQILRWNFKNPVKCNNYEQFSEGIVEFQILDGSQSTESPKELRPASTANTPIVFPINEFLRRCKDQHI